MFSIESIGLNGGALIAIIGLSEVTKKLDLNKKLKRFYPILPVIFGLVISLALSFIGENGFEVKQFVLNSLIYGGVSSLAYNLIKKTFLNINGGNNSLNGRDK